MFGPKAHKYVEYLKYYTEKHGDWPCKFMAVLKPESFINVRMHAKNDKNFYRFCSRKFAIDAYLVKEAVKCCLQDDTSNSFSAVWNNTFTKAESEDVVKYMTEFEDHCLGQLTIYSGLEKRKKAYKKQQKKAAKNATFKITT